MIARYHSYRQHPCRLRCASHDPGCRAMNELNAKGFSPEFDEYYRRRTPEELYLVAGKYGADYMLTTRDWLPGTKELQVAREGDWVVLQVPKKRADTSQP